MTTFRDKIIFITGASSGFGKACAERFAAEGARLLLCARRLDRLQTLAAELKSKHETESHVFQLDIRDRAALDTAWNSLPDEWKDISLLINNAGLARGLSFIQEGNIDDWEEMIDTNVKGLLFVSRAVLPGMVERNSGHVISIGSVAGHWLYPKGNVYCASKHAVKAITEGMRLDLFGTNVRVTEIDPGLAETEFSKVRFHGDTDRASLTYKDMQPLMAEDVADAVFYCASRPAHVNIQELVVYPTAQASVTMVSRK